jgi:hypothetical protein
MDAPHSPLTTTVTVSQRHAFILYSSVRFRVKVDPVDLTRSPTIFDVLMSTPDDASRRSNQVVAVFEFHSRFVCPINVTTVLVDVEMMRRIQPIHRILPTVQHLLARTCFPATGTPGPNPPPFPDDSAHTFFMDHMYMCRLRDMDMTLLRSPTPSTEQSHVACVFGKRGSGGGGASTHVQLLCGVYVPVKPGDVLIVPSTSRVLLEIYMTLGDTDTIDVLVFGLSHAGPTTTRDPPPALAEQGDTPTHCEPACMGSQSVECRLLYCMCPFEGQTMHHRASPWLNLLRAPVQPQQGVRGGEAGTEGSDDYDELLEAWMARVERVKGDKSLNPTRYNAGIAFPEFKTLAYRIAIDYVLSHPTLALATGPTHAITGRPRREIVHVTANRIQFLLQRREMALNGGGDGAAVSQFRSTDIVRALRPILCTVPDIHTERARGARCRGAGRRGGEPNRTDLRVQIGGFYHGTRHDGRSSDVPHPFGTGERVAPACIPRVHVKMFCHSALLPHVSSRTVYTLDTAQCDDMFTFFATCVGTDRATIARWGSVWLHHPTPDTCLLQIPRTNGLDLVDQLLSEDAIGATDGAPCPSVVTHTFHSYGSDAFVRDGNSVHGEVSHAHHQTPPRPKMHTSASSPVPCVTNHTDVLVLYNFVHGTGIHQWKLKLEGIITKVGLRPGALVAFVYHTHDDGGPIPPTHHTNADHSVASSWVIMALPLFIASVLSAVRFNGKHVGVAPHPVLHGSGGMGRRQFTSMLKACWNKLHAQMFPLAVSRPNATEMGDLFGAWWPQRDTGLHVRFVKHETLSVGYTMSTVYAQFTGWQ